MQGYVILATGRRRYLEQAVNLALSLKLNDPSRPRCLVTDQAGQPPAAWREHFDEVREIDMRPGFVGCLDKLRIAAYSPFAESMFIDADCIVAKSDMDRHWAKMGGQPFGIPGRKMTAGKWYGFEISDVLAQLEIDYMGVMNSGVFYFAATRESADFFATALDLVEHRAHLLGATHRRRLQLADEPFFGAALGLRQIAPVSYRPEEGSIMVTTYNASQMAVDPFRGLSELTKRTDFRLMGRLCPRRAVRHSPSVVHFVQLRPRSVYQALSDALRDFFDVERFAF